MKPPLVVPSGEPANDERIAFYLGLLEGGDLDQVYWATEELRDAGEAAVPALSRALETALQKNVLFAVNIVGVFKERLSGRDILPLLTRAAKQRDGPLRLEAARALGASGSPEAAAALLDLVAHGHDRLAREAIVAIETLRDPKGIRGLLGRFPDRINPRVGRLAVVMLAKHLPERELLPFLHATLSGEHVELALAAARELLRLDARAHLPAVRARLREEMNGDYREYILSILARGGDPKLLPELVSDAESGNPAVAIAAVDRLSGYSDPKARHVLWKAATSKVEEVRQQAFHSLLLSDAPRALERIVGMLESPDANDRYLAAYILTALPRDAASQPLIEALEREHDSRVAQQLCAAVAKVAKGRGATALVHALGRETTADPSLATLAHTAANYLLFLDEIPDEAIPGLVALAQSSLPSVRMNAARVLGSRCGGAEVASTVRTLLTDPSVDVRRSALESWVELPEAKIGPLVGMYRQETDPDIIKRIRQVVLQLWHRWPK